MSFILYFLAEFDSLILLSILFIYLFLNLFIYFWPRWVFIVVCGLSLVVVSGGYSLLWCMGFSLQWLLLLRSTGFRCMDFSSCGTQAQKLWHTGLVGLQHVGSSRTRDWTHVPCISRWILNHCATREDPYYPFEMKLTSTSSKTSHIYRVATMTENNFSLSYYITFLCLSEFVIIWSHFIFPFLFFPLLSKDIYLN